MKHHANLIATVPHKDVTIHTVSVLLQILSTMAIYSIIVPIFALDIWLFLYMRIYFSIQQIPYVPRSKYVILDRVRLVKLNFLQRFNCLYCDYANGVFAWARAIAQQTELYSCAIKHQHSNDFLLQKDYYNYEDFT